MNPREAAQFRLLRMIDEQSEISQRELARALGVSLGKTHYLLKALLDKGLVKANNFRRSDNKLAYAYLLTPSGISAKIELTRAFLRFKENEYEATRREIERLREELTPTLIPAAWHRFETAGDLEEALCGHIAGLAAEAISERGRFSIVITGGKSVIGLYGRLSHVATDWGAWRVFWSDERCVPLESGVRNSKLAMDAWLSRVPIPGDHLFPISAELGPETGAEKYNKLLAGEAEFDFVLLSLGEDGHVAGIFPGSDTGNRENEVFQALAVFNAPKPPAERVSLSLSRLARSRAVVLLAVGEGKREALDRLSRNIDQPATRLASVSNMAVWFDGAAAGNDDGPR